MRRRGWSSALRRSSLNNCSRAVARACRGERRDLEPEGRKVNRAKSAQPPSRRPALLAANQKRNLSPPVKGASGESRPAVREKPPEKQRAGPTGSPETARPYLCARRRAARMGLRSGCRRVLRSSNGGLDRRRFRRVVMNRLGASRRRSLGLPATPPRR